MSHVVDYRRQLLARVNRISGQIGALKRSIESAETDEECRTIMQQLSTIRGAMNGLSMVFLEEHVRKLEKRIVALERRLDPDKTS